MDLRVTVLQAFRDARGAKHRAGETGVIRSIELDWPSEDIIVEWERDGRREKMVFVLRAKDGPRNGHMREYFEAGELEMPPPPPKDRTRLARLRAELPPPSEPVTDPNHYADALARIIALAITRKFAEAEQQIQLLLAPPDPFGGRLQQLADDLVGYAVACRDDADVDIYEWLRERAISLWYAWGAQATSGGDGAARMHSIQAAEDRLARN